MGKNRSYKRKIINIKHPKNYILAHFGYVTISQVCKSNGIANNNGITYYYVTNLQGDVIRIASSNGIIGTYVYDAWGNIIATNTAGSSQNNTFSFGWYMIPTNP